MKQRVSKESLDGLISCIVGGKHCVIDAILLEPYLDLKDAREALEELRRIAREYTTHHDSLNNRDDHFWDSFDMMEFQKRASELYRALRDAASGEEKNETAGE